jgi:dephospho-CoA kinase
MLKVGLTGSIAVGKSHVLSVFEQLGCAVLDADQIAREVVRPGCPAYHDIVSHFGREVLNSDGSIDRTRLGRTVFEDEQKRSLLNSIVHPRVMGAIDRQLSEIAATQPDGIGIVDAALIIEAGLRRHFDKLIVVYCDAEAQVERIVYRDKLSHEEAVKRIRAQLTSDEKRAYADFEINTNGSLAETRQQVESIYATLRKLVGRE